MLSLKVLRRRSLGGRLDRQRHDDSRTAIAPEESRALAAELKRRIDGEVRFDNGARALYATDGSNYRQAPIGVVIPRHAGDVEATIELSRKYSAPVLSRGGGTSLAGECCNVAVLIDYSKYMRRVLEIDPKRRLARVEPGCVLDDLRGAAKRQAGLNFAPDPETHDHCTLGGMLGNNSCGVHSLMSKNNGMGLRVSDNTAELEILTYDGARFRVGPTTSEELKAIIAGGGRRGEIYARLKSLADRYGDAIRTKYPKLERRVSGYNLPDLLPENGFNVAASLVGSEGTCVAILEATLRLVPEPKARSVIVLGYPDLATAAEDVETILSFNPTALEGMDHLLFEYVKKKGDQNAALALLPEGKAFAMVEFGGDSKADSDDVARQCMEKLKKSAHPPAGMKLYDDEQQEGMIWKVREGGLGSTAWVPGMPDTWPGFEDSAVPIANVAPYIRDLRKLMHKYDYNPSLYGHLGQGCIHCRIPFDLYTAAGIEKYRSFMNEAADLVVSYGGALSGEHGDGQARGELLPKMYGPELMKAFHEFKEIWDPRWKMNPGKVIDPYSMTDNLRIGPDYNPPPVETYFSYPADRHSFGRAALRCVGVGKCRREGGGTMCPSYMVTHEEKDSTRGRARLLFEMMNGEVIEDGWKSEEVKDALDLCLSCKGCKGDCPVNVDMSTYKAEFLSHYYEGRLRPRYAYAFGWIHLWARVASLAPTLVNLLTHAPGLAAVSKWLAGVDQRRTVPSFAPQSFKAWFKAHEPRNPAGPVVALFADTFNNYLLPDTAKAAVEVLEEAGFRVTVPMADVCCGRPLYDYGFLGMARRWLIDLIVKLRPLIRDGVPIVVLEPSCWAVFKEELTNMLPEDEDAQRLKDQVYTLSDFLRKNGPPGWSVPKLQRKALLHGHCHQKAMDNLHDKEYGELFAEKEILGNMGVDFHDSEAGCCGMAGAFGYEEGKHYDVSVAAGERALLPKVRKAADDELVIADGFSCREQVRQETGREAMHLAEVLRLAIQSGPQGPVHGRPEADLVARRKAVHRRAAFRFASLATLGAVAGAVAFHVARSDRDRL